MRRTAVFLAVLVLAASAGCRRPDEGSSAPRTTAPAVVGSASTAVTGPAAPPGTTRPGDEGGVVYFLTSQPTDGGGGPYITATWRPGATTPDRAVRALLAGPAAVEPGAPELSTAIPAPVRLVLLTTAGPVATVDLAGGFDQGGGSASMFARLAQVVFTVTGFEPLERVTFRLEGQPVTVFSGEGIELGGPVGRDWFSDLGVVPPVLVERPAIGETVTAPVELTGTAHGLLGGAFTWQLTGGGEDRVATGTVRVPGGGGRFHERLAHRPPATERLDLVVEGRGDEGRSRFLRRLPFTLNPPP